jgi:hypothetical protein
MSSGVGGLVSVTAVHPGWGRAGDVAARPTGDETAKSFAAATAGPRRPSRLGLPSRHLAAKRGGVR